MLDALTRSTLDWWAEAGVDMLVEEAPRDWLARTPGAAPTPVVPAEPARPAPPADPTPADPGIV